MTKSDAIFERPSVSVCLAYYNGEQFLEEQVVSILSELNESDELLVIDDASSDQSTEVMQTFVDERIKRFSNLENLGVCASFASILAKAKTDYLILADQDDIWAQGRVRSLISALEKENSMLAVGTQAVIDKSGQPQKNIFYVPRFSGRRRFLSDAFEVMTGTSPFYGCCMAFRKDLLDLALPFPAKIESHDLWLALCASHLGGTVQTEEVVTHRRVHGANDSIVYRPLWQKLVSRMIFAYQIVVIWFRLGQLKVLAWGQKL